MSLPIVTIIGVNGAIGPFAVQALSSPTFNSKVAKPIRIVTSNAEKAKSSIPELASPDYEIITSANIITGEGLDKAFKDASIVVNLTGHTFSHNKIVDAAAAAKVKVYVPSEFGIDNANTLPPYEKLFASKQDATNYARSLNAFKVVSVFTGLFTEWAFQIPGLGGLISKDTLVKYKPDSPSVTVSLVNIGQVVAAIAAKSNSPSEIPDKVYLKGGEITAAKVAELYTKYTGIKLNIVEKPESDIVDPAIKVIETGPTNASEFLTVLRAMLTTGKVQHEAKNFEFLEGSVKLYTPEETAERLFKGGEKL